jgi:hypothetical protein
MTSITSDPRNLHRPCPHRKAQVPSWRAARGYRFPRGIAAREDYCRATMEQDDCHSDHAVQIEPGLRSRSPKNGNISNIGRRLSAVPGQKWLIPERGDRLPIRKSPPLAGISAITKDGFPESRTAWLTGEDSNCDIPTFQTPFEKSREFRPISKKSRLGDVRNYLSYMRERRRPNKRYPV